MSAKRWRRLRQTVQILGLLFFMYLFLIIVQEQANPTPGYQLRNGTHLFYRFDPLVMLTAMLAGRTLIEGIPLMVMTLLLTLFFGRVWCGWLCPFGTVLEWLSPKKMKAKPSKRAEFQLAKPPDSWRAIKYGLLFTLILAALLGNQSLLFLDPITILMRTMTSALWPMLSYGVHQAEVFLYQFDSLSPLLDPLHANLIYPLFQDMQPVFSQAVPIFLFFAGIVALNWWAERFWCRYLCPLGGLLGLLAKFSLIRREVGEQCENCALCLHDCPTDTIDPKNGYRSDPSECLVCYDCLASCPHNGIAFRRQWPNWQLAAWHDYDPSRRQALTALGAAVVTVSLAGVEPITKRQPPTMIRPPGATLTDFEALCIRCGGCIRVCPTQGLQSSMVEGGWQNLFTPQLVPRLGQCSFDCNACGQVCPTGAIPPLPLEQKQQTIIGLARLDKNRCLPWAYNIPCIVCEEMCPIADKAIQLEEVTVVNANKESITLQRPHVIKQLCIGCGICEYKCPMGGESAIRIFAPTEAGGEV